MVHLCCSVRITFFTFFLLQLSFDWHHCLLDNIEEVEIEFSHHILCNNFVLSLSDLIGPHTEEPLEKTFVIFAWSFSRILVEGSQQCNVMFYRVYPHTYRLIYLTMDNGATTKHQLLLCIACAEFALIISKLFFLIEIFSRLQTKLVISFGSFRKKGYRDSYIEDKNYFVIQQRVGGIATELCGLLFHSA